jgi:hypothetical protein
VIKKISSEKDYAPNPTLIMKPDDEDSEIGNWN